MIELAIAAALAAARTPAFTFDWTQILIAVITGGGLVALINWAVRRSERPERNQARVDTQTQWLVDQFQEELTSLRERVATLGVTADALRLEVEQLRPQVATLTSQLEQATAAIAERDALIVDLRKQAG